MKRCFLSIPSRGITVQVMDDGVDNIDSAFNSLSRDHGLEVSG